ncbi:alkylated DNA repair protein alkB homolog 8 [Galleria mellonella]|uniref:Alkylated DNA repair protein alkB homolog 8 n=1 Tax=Galleria mellonella TaxID=7137 RepID=A0ABM3N541_GALME|nr:alkylated DNA repair protein alkB homolog 8 [Galleria mellonella]XP_052758706.1 alkylated DNA repair protein alkB homolog 8 [Galleria mellonella]
MNEEKKVERKRKRFSARLKSSKGIICTDTPGPNIVLCNSGQATGLEKSFIVKLIKSLSSDIQVPKFIAEKGESHSYLLFSTTKNAILFYNTFNGKAKIDENGTPLYMSFVERVPNNEFICQHDNPQGLFLLDNFISIEEEEHLIKYFDWDEDIVSSNLKNRQVKHYGYEFRYGTNDVDLNCPLAEKIPDVCDVLWTRLKEHGFDVGVPDQLTVNKYKPGQGIPSHVDRHSPFGDTILSLSLGSAVVMDWRHHSGKTVPVLVERRCLLIMKDEARYDWQHGIQPRTWDPIIETRSVQMGNNDKLIKVVTSDTVARETRISLTFRWTRSGPCQCNFKTLCDSVEKGNSNDIEDELASNLEELHVHKVYEQIAGHFSTTRHKPWPKVVEFLEGLPPGAVLLDLGAGNGKNILRRNDILQIAGERSSGLLNECKQYTQSIPGADCLRLDLLYPGLKHSCADVVICIAVIHHFSSKARRLQAICAISNLLRPGGRALITVWAKDQTRSNYLCKSKQSQTENEHLITVGGLDLPIHENRTQFQHNDLLVPWKLRNISGNKLSDKPESTLLRYYHVFEEDELSNLCKEVPGLYVISSFYEEGNWCVVCEKNITI